MLGLPTERFHLRYFLKSVQQPHQMEYVCFLECLDVHNYWLQEQFHLISFYRKHSSNPQLMELLHCMLYLFHHPILQYHRIHTEEFDRYFLQPEYVCIQEWWDENNFSMQRLGLLRSFHHP